MHWFFRTALLTIFSIVSLTITISAIAKDGMSNLAQEPENMTMIYFPVISKQKQQITEGLDMAEFMIGNGQLYEVWRSVTNDQARHQTQIQSGKFFHTKNSEWEELWASNKYIYRGTDTSPGNGHYYTLREFGKYGSPWAPRFWKVGEIFERNPLVTFYWKDNCDIVYDNGKPVMGTQRTWLKFEAHHSSFTFPSGITLQGVVQFAWLLSPDGQPVERYYYARGFGLVGWSSNDRGFSHISEIHEPGTRPDNTREIIDCLDTSTFPAGIRPNTPIGPLPPPYRAK